MVKIQNLLSAFNIKTFVVITTVLVAVLLVTAIFFIWWVETKKKPMKEFWKIVGQKFYNFFEAIYDLFYSNGEVKTVYSDKSLNYSGTEFLPIPTKAPTNQYSYEFIGWDKNIDAFYKNENVYAVYNAVPKKYKYEFVEENGQTVVSQGVAIYGTPISAPIAPKKESEDASKAVYEFVGWKGFEEGMVLTKDERFVANYKLTPVGGTGSSSIIKTNKEGEVVKVVNEASLAPQEHSEHAEER
jgi:hypothetical protein